MPNTRRRKFSVQNKIGGRNFSEMQHNLQNSRQDVFSPKLVPNVYPVNMSNSANKMQQHTSGNNSNLKIITEHTIVNKTDTSKTTAKKNDTTSSNKDIFYDSNLDESPADLSDGAVRSMAQVHDKPTNTERERNPRQHRVKVRSPKRRLPLLEPVYNLDHRRSVETDIIVWGQEEDNFESTMTNMSEFNEIEVRRDSSQSIEYMCRICHGGESLTNELGQLVSACSCRGTVGRVHVKCLERWLTESGKSKCELCGTRYATKRIHRYGVLRAMLMWVLSQNAKQLMVDSLGIMLMSPLAILAAWLTGRTLAGLMSPDVRSTPWPLASTFVLACMTLVCYYCWIVSAATRHALGWWIWYRSQYEVRLQFQESEHAD